MTPKRKNRDAGVRRHRRAVNGPAGFGSVHPIMSVHRCPVDRLEPGDLAWARVFYSDVNDYKSRPVIVVAVEGDRVLVHRCTTSAKRRGQRGYVEIIHLAAAGLTRPTRARMTPEWVAREDFQESLGHLSATDARRILGGTSQAAA